MESDEKYVILDTLPRIEKGINKGKIDWKNSVGYEVDFRYCNINGKIKIVDYKKDIRKITISYLDCDYYDISAGHFSNCKLGNFLGIFSKKYKCSVGDIITSNVRHLKILEKIRIGNAEKRYSVKGYKYKCLKCGNIDKIAESKLEQGLNCNVCGVNPKKVVKEINSIYKTNSELIKYFANIEDTYNYTYASNKTVPLKCPDCGEIRNDISISRLSEKGYSCKRCGDGFSVPSKFMYNILRELKIEFETEKHFKWCKYKHKDKQKKGVYDFYFKINKEKYLVEVDGRQHKKGMMMISAEHQKYIDSEKNRLAKENGFKLIRIDCEKSELDFMKRNILKCELKNIFNLNNINLEKCYKSAVEVNFARMICNAWGGKKTTTQLQKEFGIARGTVRRYLKIGTICGWCKYDPKNEKIKSAKRCHKINCKKVKVYRNNIGLGTFSSIAEISNNSETLFGVKLTASAISAVCRGVSKHHKGYYFEFSKEVS